MASTTADLLKVAKQAAANQQAARVAAQATSAQLAASMGRVPSLGDQGATQQAAQPGRTS